MIALDGPAQANGTGPQKKTGNFKRFFKWVNKKVCARDTQIEDDDVDSSRRRVLSAPRRASLRLDGSAMPQVSQREQDDARLKEMRRVE